MKAIGMIALLAALAPMMWGAPKSALAEQKSAVRAKVHATTSANAKARTFAMPRFRFFLRRSRPLLQATNRNGATLICRAAAGAIPGRRGRRYAR